MDISKNVPPNAITGLDSEQLAAYTAFMQTVLDYTPEYNVQLEEVAPASLEDIPESQMGTIISWISDYIQRTGNAFDTIESEHLKIANTHGFSVRFISLYNRDSQLLDIDPQNPGSTNQGLIYVNTLEIFDIDQSPESAFQLFNQFHRLITFPEYLTAIFYYRVDNNFDPEETYTKLKNIRLTIVNEPGPSLQDLLDDSEAWHQRVEYWIQEEGKQLAKFQASQQRLLLNSPFPGLSKTFVPVSRELTMDLVNNNSDQRGEFGEISGIFDAFVTCKPTRTIPFIRIDRKNYTNQGRDSQYAIYSYSVGHTNRWKLFDENVKAELENLGFQTDTLSFLIDLYEDGTFSEATLTSQGFTLRVPSDAKLTDIEEIVTAAMLETFNINVANIAESSIKLLTKLAPIYKGIPMLQYIDPTLFQFYLLSDPNLRMYIDESFHTIGDRRKIIIHNSPNKFFTELDDYRINFEVSDPLNIYVTGPTRAKAENYFNNTFSRILHGYVLRQDAIAKALMDQFVGDGSDEGNGSKIDDESRETPRNSRAATMLTAKMAPRKVKGKKIVDTANTGIEIAKSKNDAMKRLFDLPLGYSRSCQCPRQPVLLTDDERAAWEAMKTSILPFPKGKSYVLDKREVRQYILPDGRSINFACSMNDTPFIRFVNMPREGKFSPEFYPCCWNNQWQEPIPQEEIIITTEDCKRCTSGSVAPQIFGKVKPSNDDAEDDIVRDSSAAKQIVTILPDYTKLPSSLIRFLNYGDLAERQQDYRIHVDSKGTSTIIDNHKLLECILLATGNKEYIRESRINTKTRENVLLKYRRLLGERVDPMAYRQEIFDITLRDIENEIADPRIPLTYKRHSHGLEEFFKIHLWSFLILPRKPNQESDDFQMEIPRYQVAHFKTLYSERPSVIVITFPNETGNYNLVFSNNSGYKNFMHLTRYLHTAFTTTHETVSSVISKYLGSNLYSRVNWEEFFTTSNETDQASRQSGERKQRALGIFGESKSRITGQEIDSYGKVRVIQIDNKMTISIPPTQPMGVPRISEFFDVSEQEAIDNFGQPDSYDADGFWYSWLDFKNAVYVRVSHSRPVLSVDPDAPTSVFRERLMISDILKDRLNYQKACNALVQIIHWAWRLDGRIEIKKWWNRYVKVSNAHDKDSILPRLIKVSLPSNVENATEAFKWTHTWWPEAFSSSGTVTVYPALYEKLTKFFTREAEVMAGYIADPVPPILFKIYENSGDYPEIDNRVIFTSTKSFDDWVNTRNHTNSRFFDKIPSDLSVFKSIAPVRIMHWQRMMLLQNVMSGRYDDALYVALYWSKYRINLGYNVHIERTAPDREVINVDDYKIRVIVYAVSKIMTLVPYERVEGFRYVDNEVYVVVNPIGTYSALLV